MRVVRLSPAALVVALLLLAGCATPPAPQPSPTPCVPESILELEECGPGEPFTPPAGDLRAQTSITPTNYTYTVEQYLVYMIGDLDRKWLAWFRSIRYADPVAQYAIVKPSLGYRTWCDVWRDGIAGNDVVTHDTSNAFYCPVDPIVNGQPAGIGVLILPETTFAQMWTGRVFSANSVAPGDFAAATIVAHEYGHHVADELAQQTTTLTGRTTAPLTAPYNELIADCFAGSWIYSAYRSNLLESGDLEEGVGALMAIGDYAYTAPDHHGTPEERRAALLVGYLGTGAYGPGDPFACITTYWR